MDVAKKKVAELKKELKVRGLATDRTKADLIDRLQESLISGDKDDSAEDLLNDILHDADQLLEDEKDDEKLEENTTDKGRSPSPKRKLNRSIVAVPSTEIKNSEEVIVADKAEPSQEPTEEERKKQRALKFGLSETEDSEDKKAQRAARFQLTENGKKANGNEAPEALQKRAERFGVSVETSTAEPVLKTGTAEPVLNEKKKARAERFGLQENMTTAPSDKTGGEEKKKTRAERFGGESVPSPSVAVKRPADSADVAEKKRLRAERFKSS